MPRYQAEIESLAAELDDAVLREFARAVMLEEQQRSLALEGVDWDAVLAGLGRELARRPELPNTSVDLAAQRGAALVDRGRFALAREVLTEVAERAAGGHERLGWIQASLAQLEFAEEHWIASRKWLELAERESSESRVLGPEQFRPWLDSLQAEYWVQIGMPELARDWIERLWSSAAADNSPEGQWKAFDVRLNYLLVANDYTGLGALERALADLGWLETWSERERDRAAMRFALGLVEQGLWSAADNALARSRLEGVLAAGRLPPQERAWALVGLGLAALDAGDVERAADAASELREVLAGLGTLDLARPENTVAPRLIALEGLVTMALAARGRASDEDLTARLAESAAAWASLRAGWSNVPTRDGGIGYLFLSQRQILIEALIGLQRAVLGDEKGARAALQWLMEAQHESTLARRLEAPQTTVEQARARLLDARTGLVAWIPLRSRSYALAADGARTRLFELAGVDELEARARDLSGALRQALTSDDPAARAALDARLAAARAAFLPDELERWIEPLGGLYLMGLDDAGFVPFEMLPAADGSTQGARRALSRLPSLPVGLVLLDRAARDATTDTRALALIADRPDPAQARVRGVGDLRAPPGSVREFLAALRADELSHLQGEDARWPDLERGLALPCDLLHVVAHGIQRAHERPPGILLAAAGGRTEAFAEDVEGLRAARLVLLSVCGAGRSHLRRGDGGRSDLGAAFFVAGAAAVASSFADLDLRPTLRVGAGVHGSLARGTSLAEALRDVRLEQCTEDRRLGREWIAAHSLQVGGAGLTARLRAPLGSAGPGGSADGGALTTAVAAACGGLALALLAARRAFSRTASARSPEGPRADVHRARDRSD